MTRGHYPFCRRYREACLALLAVIVLPLSGCELFSFIAQGVVQPKTKARFTLHDQSTVVLVDDPEGSLGNPTLPNVIANRVAFELKQNMAVTTIVPPDRLHALAAKPPDQVKGPEAAGATAWSWRRPAQSGARSGG